MLHRKTGASRHERRALVESLERRQFLSASYPMLESSDAVSQLVTEAVTPAIPRLKTTYHGAVAGSNSTADAALHIDTFTHTGHFTADLELFLPDGSTFNGTVTGAVRANRRFAFTFTGSISTGGTASGTVTGKVTPSGKGIGGTVYGTTSKGGIISGTLSVTRK